MRHIVNCLSTCAVASWMACWARVGCLSVRPWQFPPSTWWGARSACPPARRAATQMAATKAAVQTTGAPEVATHTGGSDVGGGVYSSGDACGGCEVVKDPISVWELATPRWPSSASGYATADATGSN